MYTTVIPESLAKPLYVLHHKAQRVHKVIVQLVEVIRLTMPQELYVIVFNFYSYGIY
jgi:hypothetical protein